MAGGTVPQVLAEVDGDPSSAFKSRDEYVTDPSMLGPLLDGEYYTFAPDTWGSDSSHNIADGDSTTVGQFVQDLDFVLGNNHSISLYVCAYPSFEFERTRAESMSVSDVSRGN